MQMGPCLCLQLHLQMSQLCSQRQVCVCLNGSSALQHKPNTHRESAGPFHTFRGPAMSVHCVPVCTVQVHLLSVALAIIHSRLGLSLDERTDTILRPRCVNSAYSTNCIPPNATERSATQAILTLDNSVHSTQICKLQICTVLCLCPCVCVCFT